MRGGGNILAVETAAQSSGSPDVVATTGVCRVHPGAINSIPDRVILEIDVRDIHIEPRDRVVHAIRRAVDEIAGRRQVESLVEWTAPDPPANKAWRASANRQEKQSRAYPPRDPQKQSRRNRFPRSTTGRVLRPPTSFRRRILGSRPISYDPLQRLCRLNPAQSK